MVQSSIESKKIKMLLQIWENMMIRNSHHVENLTMYNSNIETYCDYECMNNRSTKLETSWTINFMWIVKVGRLHDDDDSVQPLLPVASELWPCWMASHLSCICSIQLWSNRFMYMCIGAVDVWSCPIHSYLINLHQFTSSDLCYVQFHPNIVSELPQIWCNNHMTSNRTKSFLPIFKIVQWWFQFTIM